MKALAIGLLLLTALPAPVHAAPNSDGVEDFIYLAANTYGVSPAWLRRTAVCESQLNPAVTSKNGLYHGLFQYSWRTWNWMSAQAGWQGYSPYDAEAAAFVTAWAFSNGHRGHWPRCSYV